MFDGLKMAPPDAIFGLTEAFKRDPNPAKINLTIGVYRDAKGNTPIFDSVKRAEARLIEQEISKSYLSIDGSPAYTRAVQQLVLGLEHEIIVSQRAATAQTPGGTAALRVAGDLLNRVRPHTRIWVSEPTWANHRDVFSASGLAVESYPYYDVAGNDLAFDTLLSALKGLPEGDVVLLHGCCHNPTGADPSPEQWRQIGDVLAERNLLPLVDFAYQGLANGLREDAAGIEALCRPDGELLIATSYSKNFGLYNERVGALTIVTKSREAAETAASHAQKCIRANYSNPPAHGSAIVSTVLGDPDLAAEWEGEVAAMRARINAMRQRFVDALAAKGVARDFSFIARQRGMFSYTGLTPEQVRALREKHSIYLLNSSRINVAGLTEANVDAVCEAIADVL
ncbi:MAG: aspartate/tyrosine/aromatic aminotransferase [Anaerolineae bacterium]|nr:aspartate/tyrosine/aromatic aminotransferase [Anaerolineae bacterium]